MATANPLEAHAVAVRTLMALANSADDEDLRFRAAEALIESTLPLPGDGWELIPEKD